MAMELRKTGISVVGDVPWGTHYSYFYETTQDLLDTLAPNFKDGLETASPAWEPRMGILDPYV